MINNQIPPDTVFDVVVIGAGVVGTAIARDLSHFDCKVLLAEALSDVGAGTSKANTAILHTGFDAPPGSLESKLLTRGYRLLLDYSERTGIPVETTGAILVAWNEEQLSSFPAIRTKAGKNGVTEIESLTVEEVYKLEPNLGPGALGGLFIKGESIISPFAPPLAYAAEAVENGAAILLNSPLTGIESNEEVHKLRLGDKDILARWVINAAGLNSDTIDAMFGHKRFTVTPRRGELIVFDKPSRNLINHILLPVPTKTTKGVLVSPTVFGNVLLGPTAEDLRDREETGTSKAGLSGLMGMGMKIMPALLKEEVIATYAGLRAATEHSDYQIHLEAGQRYICVGGIRSTGLSASLGIAGHVSSLIREGGLQLRPKAEFREVKSPPLGRLQQRPWLSEEKIASNPDYGRIFCHCEKVSKGELVDAMNWPVPALTIDGLKRRTRCLNGRCQGFNCMANIVALMAEKNK